MKLYIFDCVKIVHDRTVAICVITLNHDVSSMSHCIEIISHSFSILPSVELASILCTGSIECYQERPIFLAKIAIVTHLRINLCTCVVPKIWWDHSCGYSKAVRMDSTGYLARGGLRPCRICT